MTQAEFSDAEAQNALGDVYLHRADRAMESNDLPAALIALQEAEERCPLAPNILVDTAVAYGKVGASNRVVPTLQKALRLRPNHYTGNLNLGLSYANQGMYLQAMQCFQTAARAVPSDPMAPQLMRQIQALMGNRP